MTNKLIQLFSTYQKLNIHFFFTELSGGCIGLNYDQKFSKLIRKIALAHGFVIILEHEYKYSYNADSNSKTIIF